MKKTHIYPLAALLLCLFTLQACVKTDDLVEDTSSLWYHEAGNLVSISGDETQAEFQITSDCPWRIEMESGSWASVEPQSGNGSQKVTVVADGTNPSSTDARRSYFVLVTQDGVSKRVTVEQSPSTAVIPPTPAFAVSPAAIAFAANDNSAKQITITSNTAWWVNYEAWVHVSQDSGTGDATLTITCDNNPTPTPRTATVYFTFGPAESYYGEPAGFVTITQAAGQMQTVGATAVGEVDETRAYVSAMVTFTEFPVTDCGFCIGTENNPSETGTRLPLPNTPQTGIPFGVTLNNLTKKTHYYVCAYVTTAMGTVYGPVSDFETLSIPREGDLGKPNH